MATNLYPVQYGETYDLPDGLYFALCDSEPIWGKPARAPLVGPLHYASANVSLGILTLRFQFAGTYQDKLALGKRYGFTLDEESPSASQSLTYKLIFEEGYFRWPDSAGPKFYGFMVGQLVNNQFLIN